MPVQLKDAQITVKLDVTESVKKVDSLEKKHEKRREEEDKQERQQKAIEKKIGWQSRQAGSKIGAALGGGLIARTIERVLTALAGIPLVEVLAVGAIGGIAAAELSEKFGPFLDGAIGQYLKKLGLPEDTLSSMGEGWNDMKNKLASLERGFQSAVGMAYASYASGQPLGPDQFFTLFTEQRAYAEHLMDMERVKYAMKLRIAGQSASKQAREEFEKAMSGDLWR